MELKKIDPYQVNVDEMNERTENLHLKELEKSVAEQNVIQPPIIRERNGDREVPYSVVVGQRRVLAAQGAGKDAIPVVVVDWDDAEALEKSISENIETFREDVSRRDRAFAITRLKEMKGWNNREVADALGVHRKVIENWLEYTRDEWDGTVIHPEVEDSETEDVRHLSQKIDDISPDIVQKVRSATGGGKEGEELLQHVVEHDLNKDDVRELAKKVDRGSDVDEALARTIEEKQSTGDIKVKANVTFSGDRATAIEQAAKDRGMTENEVVREAMHDYLEREGYL